MNSKIIPITTDEIDFFKRRNWERDGTKQEPDSWVNPLLISPHDWPPPKDWLEEAPHPNHKVKSIRGGVCLCVWEKFGKANNRALIDYFKLIIPHIHLPLDLDNDMKIVDGRHRLIAYKELNILVPVFIGRKQIRFGYCWRKGIAYSDGTIDVNAKNKKGYYALR